MKSQMNTDIAQTDTDSCSAMHRCPSMNYPHLSARHFISSGDLIRDLSEIGPDDHPLVGGKAFHLGLLMRSGFNVPKGFAVTSNAFHQVVAAAGGQPRLSAPLRAAVIAAWRRAGFTEAAVRSSASEEDGRQASWAGVFPTLLPVTGEEELVAAVERCFAALHSPEADLYRAKRRSAAPPAMAVLVQELVPARAAGIIYTAHPLTGGGDHIVVNAVRGLGEPLAAGRISGDTFVLGRDGCLKAATVTGQPFMLTPAGEVPLAGEARSRPAISETEASALARLAVDVETVFSCPQDIEFAIGGETIHLLQSRPITRPSAGAAIAADEIDAYVERERRALTERLAAARRRGRLSARPAVFSNGNVGELLPTPTPMSFGLFDAIFAGSDGAVLTGRRRLGYRLAEDAATGLYELICGQPYFNLEVDARTFDIGLAIDIDEILSGVAGDPARANYPEFGLYRQEIGLADAIRRFGAAEGRRRHDTLKEFHTAMTAAAQAFRVDFTDHIERRLRDSLRKAARLLPSTMDRSELVAAFQAQVQHLQRESCVWFVMAARLAFYFADMVRGRLQRHLGDGGGTAALLQGLAGSRITRQALDLERLAKGRLMRFTFLARYGHMASNELEIALPRLAEEPAAIDRLLHDFALSGRRPAEEFRQQRQRRQAAERNLLQRLRAAGVTPADIEALFADLRLAQTFLPLRETIKYYFAAEYAALRAILVEINDRLGWAEGDVFHLHPREIAGCFSYTAQLAEVAEQRRRERRIAGLLASQRRLPAVIFQSDLAALGTRREGTAAGRLEAVPVAPGAAVGVVRILDDSGALPATTRLAGGEIIVARSANLGLAPLMRMAAGLVVEVGGVLAHAACQARESGIPAVVLACATTCLKDGMTVSLDGDRGIVEIIAP